MVSKKLSIIGLLSATALVSGVLVGCGGSSSNLSGSTPSVTATGGVTTSSGGLTPGTAGTTANSTSPQQIQVTVNGTSEPGVVPPGTPAITSSTVLDIIPENVPFVNNAGFAAVKAHAPTAHPVNISYDQGAHWAYSGADVNPDLSFTKNIVIVAGTSPWLQLPGGYTFLNGLNSLTIQTFVFGTHVDANGIISFPSNYMLTLPTNGGSTQRSNQVQATYPSDFPSGTVTLSITGLVTGTKTQTQTFTTPGQTITFEEPIGNNPNTDKVPAGGVDTVSVIFYGAGL